MALNKAAVLVALVAALAVTAPLFVSAGASPVSTHHLAGGYCNSNLVPGGCTRMIWGWDTTGDVNLNQFESPDACDCLTKCASHNFNGAIAEQCQTYVFNPANSVANGGQGSCTHYADISPGFAGVGNFLTTATTPLPYIGLNGVSGVMLGLSSPKDPNAFAAFAC